ncbi:MAG: response regulator transcription factor [Verrucomicrobia bacterium]|nr:response regulator transcription factor [Verrucomicrobiota bacterium]
MRILAIEDQPVAAMQLLAVLKSQGHTVDAAHDGEEAWRMLESGGHRIVVSDWRVPGIDGLQLCRMIRNRGGDYVYFILISSIKVTRERQAEALAAGVDDFLRKPVDPDELGMRLHVAARIIEFTNRVQQLESFLPICGYCKKVRSDEKYWQAIEDYYARKQGTKFSHGICPDCYQKVMLPQLARLGIGEEPVHPPPVATAVPSPESGVPGQG